MPETAEPCAFCGKKEASGYAFIGDLRYCHGDNDPTPTCYTQGLWDIQYGGLDAVPASLNFSLPQALALHHTVRIEDQRVPPLGRCTHCRHQAHHHGCVMTGCDCSLATNRGHAHG